MKLSEVKKKADRWFGTQSRERLQVEAFLRVEVEGVKLEQVALDHGITAPGVKRRVSAGRRALARNDINPSKITKD